MQPGNLPWVMNGERAFFKFIAAGRIAFPGKKWAGISKQGK
jgi:hypothetical protein